MSCDFSSLWQLSSLSSFTFALHALMSNFKVERIRLSEQIIFDNNISLVIRITSVTRPLSKIFEHLVNSPRIFNRAKEPKYSKQEPLMSLFCSLSFRVLNEVATRKSQAMSNNPNACERQAIGVGRGNFPT